MAPPFTVLAASSRPMRGHHRPHGRGRQDDVDPVGAELPHHQGQQAAQQPRDHKAALGVFKAQLRDDDARGR